MRYTPRVRKNVATIFALELKHGDCLTDREKRILELRYGLNDYQLRTLDKVGIEFGISRERVRQIQNATLAKIGFTKEGNPE